MDDLRTLQDEIKALLVRELNLQGRSPSSIGDEVPLFGAVDVDGGLGLDSLDALELAMSIEETFGVRIPEGDDARPIFRSVRSLAEHVLRERTEEASLKELPDSDDGTGEPAGS
jgi:acyl carrier protein